MDNFTGIRLCGVVCAEKTIRHLVEKIRRGYRPEVPIIVRMDSGFFDQKLWEVCERLHIGYLVAGKLYQDLQGFISKMEASAWEAYRNGDQEWSYVELGDRRDSWKKFRRAVFCRPVDEDGQRLLEFARPDQVLYTNLGCGYRVDDQLRAAGLERWLEAEALLEGYHQRGGDELVHRALKEFAGETLPFKRFPANAAYYYTLLVAFFLYECFKEDVCSPVVAVTAYPTTLRRRIIDIAGKIVRHAGQLILKVTVATWHQLQLEQLWRQSAQPPRFAWG